MDRQPPQRITRHLLLEAQSEPGTASRSRAQIIVDGNFVSARTVMAGRFEKEFAYTPIGTVQPNGRQVQWELINIFRFTDEGRLVEEWVQTDTYDFLRQLGAVT